MKKENKFLAIFSTFILLTHSTGYILYITGTLSHSDWTAFSAGAFFTTLNFIIGLISLKTALNGSQKRFLILVFGGMLIRMFLLLTAVFLALKFLQIKLNVFIFVIFVFYSLFLIAEIFYFYLLREQRH